MGRTDEDFTGPIITIGIYVEGQDLEQVRVTPGEIFIGIGHTTYGMQILREKFGIECPERVSDSP